MARIIADRRDIDFVLYEQLDTEDLIRFPKYREFNRKHHPSGSGQNRRRAQRRQRHFPIYCSQNLGER